MADGSNDKKDDKNADAQDAKKRPARWPFVLAGIALLCFVGAIAYVAFVPRPDAWTDDAYVSVHYAQISARIAGQVTAVMIDDNQTVHGSQLLVQLDDRDQRASLANAQATLERDRAQFRDALANVDRQPSVIAEQEASASAYEAQLTLARANQRRYRNLATTGAGTEQSRQQADAALAQLEAQIRGAHASADAARHQLEVLRAQGDADRATIRSDEARVDQARLNLSYTRVPAPLAGMVSNRSVQVGDTITAGQTLMAVVPLDRLYVVANYREPALKNVLPGQHVRIHVDAYDLMLDGVVQGIPPASGAVFSTVPPNNATGNFTKIVQRLPVKILVSPGQPLAKLLRAGFSVETTIQTHFADVKGAQAQTDARVTAE